MRFKLAYVYWIMLIGLIPLWIYMLTLGLNGFKAVTISVFGFIFLKIPIDTLDWVSKPKKHPYY